MDRRYPFTELCEITELTVNQIARRTGLSGTTLRDAHERGGMSRWVADRTAVRLGHHPYLVWPTMIDDDIADTSATCPECGDTFLPRSPRQRFCRDLCRTRTSSRLWKQRNPDKNRADRAAYYAENRDYELRRDQRRREAKQAS